MQIKKSKIWGAHPSRPKFYFNFLPRPNCSIIEIILWAIEQAAIRLRTISGSLDLTYPPLGPPRVVTRELNGTNEQPYDIRNY